MKRVLMSPGYTVNLLLRNLHYQVLFYLPETSPCAVICEVSYVYVIIIIPVEN